MTVSQHQTTLNIEQSFPIHEVNKLASVESYRPDIYRPVNHIHKWWARRLGSVFRAISLATFLPPGEDVWGHYYEKTTFDSKIVLDPFMGSGTTLMEALRLSCQVVGVDINPVAWFSVKKGIEPASPAALASGFQQVTDQVAKRIQDLFRTQCPHCQRNADIAYTLWVKLAPCATCGEITALHTSYTFRRSRQGKHYILCPLCGHLFAAEELRAYERCPACSHTFDPKRGPSPGGSATFVCTCGARQSILDAVQRKDGPLDYKMYAILYICPVHGRGFKKPTDADLAHFQRASAQFERLKSKLLIPNQMIPPGEKTDVLIAHGYHRWAELYSPRQLLALAWVLEALRSLPDANIREHLLLLFSASLDYNCMLATYKGGEGIRQVFAYHAFIPPKEALENNPWGTEKSAGALPYLYQTKLKKAVEYTQQPTERFIASGGKSRQVGIPGERLEAHLASTFADLVARPDKNALVLCQSSEDLSIPDGQVDAVITDPPYFDNVMYAELSDHFYVWLRLLLQDDYPWFQSELTPKIGELLKANKQGKDEQFFLEGLKQVLSECHRVLKPDGPLIFTFHHKESEAWASTLQAVLDADFYISALYPIQAEMGGSLHIRDLEAIEYDAIIVCRKRTGDGHISWEQLEDQIHFQAAETLRQLRRPELAEGQTTGPGLSRADVSVIVLGKCLELYSKHYPNVMEGDRPVQVEEAVTRLWSIIDSLSTEEVMSRLPADLDEVTKAYAITLAGHREMGFDELNKRLRHRGLSTAVFSDENLVEIDGKKVRVVEPVKRTEYIGNRLERGQLLRDIDRVHHLYAEYRYGANFRQYRERFRSPALDELCRYLAEVTGDTVYDKIVEAAF